MVFVTDMLGIFFENMFFPLATSFSTLYFNVQIYASAWSSRPEVRGGPTELNCTHNPTHHDQPAQGCTGIREQGDPIPVRGPVGDVRAALEQRPG